MYIGIVRKRYRRSGEANGADAPTERTGAPSGRTDVVRIRINAKDDDGAVVVQDMVEKCVPPHMTNGDKMMFQPRQQ